MTDQEILTKAIQKAIDGGWKYKEGRGKSGELLSIDKRFGCTSDIIFNHNFAKALWPEKDEPVSFFAATNTFGKEQKCTRWQYHLQQMVIAEDPIRYLGEHLNV